jgi:hypothetical protein
MTDTKTAEQLAGEVKAAFDAKHDQVKALAEEALGKAQKGEDLSTATKQLADEALVGMNEAKARLDELEQKIARKGADDETRPRSIGEQVLAADEMKAFLASRASRGRASVEVKAIITSVSRTHLSKWRWSARIWKPCRPNSRPCARTSRICSMPGTLPLASSSSSNGCRP